MEQIYFNTFVTEKHVSGRGYSSSLDPYQTFFLMLGSYQPTHSTLGITKKASLYMFPVEYLPMY